MRMFSLGFHGSAVVCIEILASEITIIIRRMRLIYRVIQKKYPNTKIAMSKNV